VEKQDTGSILHTTPLDSCPISRTPWTRPVETPSQWWTRQSVKTSSNQGQVTAEDIRTKIYHTAPILHLAVDGTKTTPKAKRKALTSEFLQTNHVVIQNLLYRPLSPLLFFIQARRTGFAALKWQAILGKTSLKYFTVILITCFLLCLAFTLGPELACSGGMGEIFEAFCVVQRALAMESCLWARYLNLVHVSFIYVFYFR
jgi:hypothetical protein